jgi:hypothetical protein
MTVRRLLAALAIAAASWCVGCLTAATAQNTPTPTRHGSPRR